MRSLSPPNSLHQFPIKEEKNLEIIWKSLNHHYGKLFAPSAGGSLHTHLVLFRISFCWKRIFPATFIFFSFLRARRFISFISSNPVYFIFSKPTSGQIVKGVLTSLGSLYQQECGEHYWTEALCRSIGKRTLKMWLQVNGWLMLGAEAKRMNEQPWS